MPKVLIIAYHFHPDLEVGAVRSVKFAKYLPSYGWDPYILTVETRYYPTVDTSDHEYSFKIHRTSKWLTLDDLISMLKKKIKRHKNPENNSGQKISDSTASAGERLPIRRPLWKKLIDSLSATPDEHIGWFFPGVFAAIKLIRKNKIDIIYASGPPFTGHLIGLAAKFFTGRKLVVDFRDPWTMGVRLYAHSNKLSDFVERCLERAVITKARLIITATPLIASQFKNKYYLKDGKCSTIFNGYDEEDFEGRVKMTKNKNEPLSFLYAGTLYMGRDPSAFFEAVSELIAENLINKEEIRIEFVGKNDLGDAKIRNLIRELKLDGIVFSSGPIPKDRYFDKIMNADVLLVIQSEMANSAIPGKTFEYLATGNKILALIPPGMTSEFLSQFNSVLEAGINDKKAIKNCITKLMNERNIGTNTIESDKVKLREITRRKQTEKLAQIMSNLTN